MTATLQPPASKGVDARAPRFGQALTTLFTLTAFALTQPALVALTAAVLGAGAVFGPTANLWNHLYARVWKPLARLGPARKLKNAAPPRFANAVGFIFLGAAAIVLYGVPGETGALLGWGLTLIVAALAALGAVADYCVGCEIYVLLVKLLKRGDDATAG